MCNEICGRGYDEKERGGAKRVVFSCDHHEGFLCCMLLVGGISILHTCQHDGSFNRYRELSLALLVAFVF